MKENADLTYNVSNFWSVKYSFLRLCLASPRERKVELSRKMRRQIRKEIEYQGVNLAKLAQGKINNQNLFEISNL